MVMKIICVRIKQRFVNLRCMMSILFRKRIKGFTKDQLRKISLKDTAYDFSYDHSLIEKEHIFNIHKYLIKDK